jgi:hypothetical protein
VSPVSIATRLQAVRSSESDQVLRRLRQRILQGQERVQILPPWLQQQRLSQDETLQPLHPFGQVLDIPGLGPTLFVSIINTGHVPGRTVVARLSSRALQLPPSTAVTGPLRGSF